MKVRELMSILKGFRADADVRLALSWPDRVTETYDRLWVGDYGGGRRSMPPWISRACASTWVACCSSG